MPFDEQNRVRAGRSLEELRTPRSWGMPSPEIFDGALLNIEDQLGSSVPEEVRKRIGVTRNLAVYGAFCYDFITVSVFWSFTCVEMALWTKFRELNPGPFVLEKKKIEQDNPSIPVIVLTAREGMAEMFKVEGAREYLLKPLQPEVLMKSIHRCI